jgi:hypothetical protein
MIVRMPEESLDLPRLPSRGTVGEPRARTRHSITEGGSHDLYLLMLASGRKRCIRVSGDRAARTAQAAAAVHDLLARAIVLAG